MVDDTLQQRELELKKIMAQYDSNSNNATEWLKGEETSTAICVITGCYYCIF